MGDLDYRAYYDLENYLFNEVRGRFEANGQIDAFDFFCIVIWKANRAKSRISGLLLGKANSLEGAVTDLTSKIAAQKNNKSKLKLMISGWGFRLPMASAVLTVLYPKDFTVYDFRVCDLLEQLPLARHTAGPARKAVSAKGYHEFR